jgi:2,7-dihydroxy-5-methyl-1-naphthoate 7-O-methyltransferase
MTGTLDQIAVQKLTALADIITPWAVRTAATLRLADMLGPGPRSVADLATQTGASSDALRRLLWHLAHHELFHEIGPDLFAVTDTGGVLAGDHPSGLRAWLDASGAGARMDQAFAGLPESVLTGAPAYRTIFGRPFWADLASRPELSASFDALLAHQSAALS